MGIQIATRDSRSLWIDTANVWRSNMISRYQDAKDNSVTLNGQKLILIVEDDLGHAELIQRAFEDRNESAVLMLAGSIQEARAVVANNTPSLVIADMFLPDGQGLELLPEESSDIIYPVVIMTSQGDEKAAVAAMKAGALDYIPKSDTLLADMPHFAARALREWEYMLEIRRAREIQIENERLKFSLEKQRDVVELRSRFLSALNHELRAPLAVILASSSMLSGFWHKLAEEKRKQKIELISDQVMVLGKMLDDLAFIVQADQGSLDNEPTRFDLTSYCQEIVAVSQNVYLGRELVFMHRDSVGDVYLDRDLIQHMLVNLITSIAQDSPHDSTLYFELGRRENNVLFHIRAAAENISDEDLERLLVPEKQVSTAGVTKEKGLMWLAVKEVVDLYGGTLLYDDLDGQGAAVMVLLPEYAVESAESIEGRQEEH